MSSSEPALQRGGLWVGTALFALMLMSPAPAGLPVEGWRVAALTVLIGCWWFTEAVPVTLTGSLPFLALPLLGVVKADAVAALYMSPVLFLILGGTLVGSAFEKWGLHRRVALAVVARVDPQPRTLLFAVMAVTASVSMWVNNSSTTVMMLPIAMAALAAVTGERADGASRDVRNFSAAMILSVSLASNLGGFATPIGTPVNSIAIGILERSYDTQLSFAGWMAFGVPFMLFSLPACWWILSRVTLPFDLEGPGRDAVRVAIGEPGPWTTPQRRTLAAVLLVALAWVFQPLVERVLPGISDAGIAVAGALLLAVLPSGDDRPGEPRRLLEWEDAKRAPWYLILLLGGGLALADAVVKSGLSAWLGSVLGAVVGLPLLPMLLAIALLCGLITEAASNVATATIFMPVAASLAMGAGYDPTLAALCAAMAANLGFANPAATSSNALVYSTGRVPITAMLKTGLLVDLVGAVLIALLCATVVPLVR
ncbi:MAG: SLC13 family permease [Gammaproteobacteria bacterium]